MHTVIFRWDARPRARKLRLAREWWGLDLPLDAPYSVRWGSREWFAAHPYAWGKPIPHRDGYRWLTWWWRRPCSS